MLNCTRCAHARTIDRVSQCASCRKVPTATLADSAAHLKVAHRAGPGGAPAAASASSALEALAGVPHAQIARFSILKRSAVLRQSRPSCGRAPGAAGARPRRAGRFAARGPCARRRARGTPLGGSLDGRLAEEVGDGLPLLDELLARLLHGLRGEGVHGDATHAAELPRVAHGGHRVDEVLAHPVRAVGHHAHGAPFAAGAQGPVAHVEDGRLRRRGG
mmetsp:Transcript_5315/g.17954  ORF Transcript_5315/g.17954 Transcript_5315/m.17954 type:complete len:218 (+) Transcript_5315:1011-1664(+)